MLPKENRLRNKKDFDRISTRGRQVSGNFLILKFQSNELNLARIGFVVSKKVSKKAVLRNKVKRRLREAVKRELVSLKPGFDLVFFTRREIKDREFSDIQQAVKQLFEKAKLYNA